MRWLFLLASFFSVLMALLFVYVSVYYVLNYPQSWRVIAPLSVVALWTMLTYKAFLPLSGNQTYIEIQNGTQLIKAES